MKRLALSIISLILFYGCAQPTHGPLLLRNTKSFYQGTGVVKYFLSELPNWANASNESACQRSYTVKYFNFSNLKASFDLSYSDSVQLQYLFNISHRTSKENYQIELLPLKQEEKIFYDSFDKIKAKLYPFRFPTYKRVNFIWVDPYLKDKKGTRQLVALMKSAIMTKGHPVWVSSCYGRKELDASIKSLKLDTFNIRVLGIEAFSPYSQDNVLMTEVRLSLRDLFPGKRTLYLYIKNGMENPTEILSVDKVINY